MENYDTEKYLDDGWRASQEGVEENVEAPTGQAETESESTEALQDSTQESGEKKELSLKEQLEGLELDKTEETKETQNDLLSALNALGVTRNSLPVEFESEEQIKELLSKGFDYTQKTQEAAEARKTAEEEIAKQREEAEKIFTEANEAKERHHEDLLTLEVFMGVLKKLREDDPMAVETIEEMFAQDFNQRNAYRNDPMVKGLQEKIQDLESRVEGKDAASIEKENETIVKEWETGLADVQKRLGTRLHTIGVKPDWKKVQDAWKSDSSANSTVEDALYQAHGKEIVKGLESYNKLLETKAKQTLRTNDSEAEQVTEEDKKPAARPDSYLDAAYKITRKLGITA